MNERTHDQAVKRRRRALKAQLVAMGVAKAKADLALAMINATSAALPPNVIADLDRSVQTLETTLKATERFRLRQLRKVNQLETING